MSRVDEWAARMDRMLALYERMVSMNGALMAHLMTDPQQNPQPPTEGAPISSPDNPPTERARLPHPYVS